MAQFFINIDRDDTPSTEIVGESVLKGDIVYLSADNKWYLASATSKVKSTTELKLVLHDALQNSLAKLISYGYSELTNKTLIPGSKYYLDTTSGKITTNVFDAKELVVRYIGTAFDNKLLLFNPDSTYILGDGSEINEVKLDTFEDLDDRYVRHDIPQGLSPTNKQIARINIDAAGINDNEVSIYNTWSSSKIEDEFKWGKKEF